MKKELVVTLTQKKVSTVLAIIIGIDIFLYFLLDSVFGNSRLLNGLFVLSMLIPGVLAKLLLSYVDYKKEQLSLRNKEDNLFDAAADTFIDDEDLFDL